MESDLLVPLLPVLLLSAILAGLLVPQSSPVTGLPLRSLSLLKGSLVPQTFFYTFMPTSFSFKEAINLWKGLHPGYHGGYDISTNI